MATKRSKLISTSLLRMLSISVFVCIVSEDASAAEAAEGYSHLEAEYTENIEGILSIDKVVVVTLRIKGIGGMAEDLLQIF